MKLFVYHTPEATPTDHLPDCAVVIDVLRATTTMAAALHAGAEAVQVFSDIEKLLAAGGAWPSAKRACAGERGGAKVSGCDFGNSPLEYSAERIAGKRLFMSTTNGTRALERVAAAPLVITAAQVNRRAVVSFLQAKRPESVWLVGSGWQGSYALEDTVCAGSIAATLADWTAGNDETTAAIALYSQWQGQLLELFHKASHGQRLLGLDCAADLEYCAQSDVLETLPIQRSPGLLVAG